MQKKKLTGAERAERDARHARVLANADRTPEPAERAQAKLDAANARRAS
jgi:plasmid stabilization system protein ParE